jgi:hypothetical protein
MIVKDLEDPVSSPDSLLNRRGISWKHELERHLGHITVTLKELEDLVSRYSSLGLTRQRTWDRIRFASKNIRDIRDRLNFYVSNITFFLESLAGGALAHLEGLNSESRDTLVRIEKILSDLVSEVKLGLKEPTLLSENEDDLHNVWDQLRHELECEGLSTQFILQYKSPIKSFLKTLLQEAGLEDLVASDPSLEIGDLGSEIDQVYSQVILPGGTRGSVRSKRMTSSNFTIGDGDSRGSDDETTLELDQTRSVTFELQYLEENEPFHRSNMSSQEDGGESGQSGQSPPFPDIPVTIHTTRLNTYIYEYFLKAGAYECARALVNNKELWLDC